MQAAKAQHRSAESDPVAFLRKPCARNTHYRRQRVKGPIEKVFCLRCQDATMRIEDEDDEAMLQIARTSRKCDGGLMDQG